MTGREILEEVVALLGQVPEGDEAEELCVKLREWLVGADATGRCPSGSVTHPDRRGLTAAGTSSRPVSARCPPGR